MNIWVVRVRMCQSVVFVRVRMRLLGRVTGLVLVLMVAVMNMAVVVFQRLVDMCVLVTFREVEPDADRHKSSRTG